MTFSKSELISILFTITLTVAIFGGKSGLAYWAMILTLLSIFSGIRFIYKKIYFNIKRPICVDGIVINTFLEERMILFSRGVRAGTSFERFVFNCIEINTHKGNRFKVYESRSNQEEYDGSQSIGNQISISVYKFDRSNFMEEELYRQYKR